MAKSTDPVLKNRRSRARKLVRGLQKRYPDVECALRHDTPFQLLVATILSAQCTDERVNAATVGLFEKYPDAPTLAASRQKDIERIIHSLGFFRAKATNIRGMARIVVDDFDGEVPETLEELVALPGVGRKTANVLLGTSFGIPSGVVVDTHVKRISKLFGLVNGNSPEAIERELMDILPRKEWIMYSHRVIHHGRQICIARRPRCTECPLLANCGREGLAPIEE